MDQDEQSFRKLVSCFRFFQFPQSALSESLTAARREYKRTTADYTGT